MVKRGKFFAGTSNVVITGNRQTFPEAYRQKSRLHYYATLFNSVELNSTFYKLPRAATFEKWSGDVPADFKFSIKLWKEITHVKELHFKDEDISRFMMSAEMINAKSGCLLIQFPGKISLDYFGRMEVLLQQIKQADKNKQWTMAVEFRNDSWYVSETNELLDEYNAAMVIHDIRKGKNSSVNKKAPAVYIRFHGPAGDYRGSYDKKFLASQAVLINEWMGLGKDVYAYFNNTIGSAFENSKTLQQLVNSNADNIQIN